MRSDIVQDKDNYDSLVRGMLTQHAQGQDQFFTKEVFYFGFIIAKIVIESIVGKKLLLFLNNKYVNCLIQITEFLFKSPNKTDGSDLITLDIERGRDFGEPSYNKFRQLCGLRAARTFGDFTDQISKKVMTFNTFINKS